MLTLMKSTNCNCNLLFVPAFVSVCLNKIMHHRHPFVLNTNTLLQSISLLPLYHSLRLEYRAARQKVIRGTYIYIMYSHILEVEITHKHMQGYRYPTFTKRKVLVLVAFIDHMKCRWFRLCSISVYFCELRNAFIALGRGDPGEGKP